MEVVNDAVQQGIPSASSNYERQMWLKEADQERADRHAKTGRALVEDGLVYGEGLGKVVTSLIVADRGMITIDKAEADGIRADAQFRR